MPLTIDEAKLQGKNEPGQDSQIIVSMDLHHPPTKQIPHLEYPKVVYKHPKEPFRTIEHRNAQREVVQKEVVPNEHLSMLVNDKKELTEALKNGWLTEPYIPQAPPSLESSIY